MAIFNNTITCLLNYNFNATNVYSKYSLSYSFIKSLGIKEKLENISAKQIEEIYFNNIWLKNKYYLIESELLASLVFITSVELSVTFANRSLYKTLATVCNTYIEPQAYLSNELIQSISDLTQNNANYDVVNTYQNNVGNYVKSVLKVKPKDIKCQRFFNFLSQLQNTNFIYFNNISLKTI